MSYLFLNKLKFLKKSTICEKLPRYVKIKWSLIKNRLGHCVLAYTRYSFLFKRCIIIIVLLAGK